VSGRAQYKQGNHSAGNGSDDQGRITNAQERNQKSNQRADSCANHGHHDSLCHRLTVWLDRR
jgi:hypothetical protein